MTSTDISTPEFLSTIFHTLPQGADVAIWPNGTRGFPARQADGLRVLDKLKDSQPRDVFYGCASLYPDDAGVFRNLQARFAAYHILVLDDIGDGPGSKIAVADVPPELVELASYQLETSPGNWQYGYILDAPITDLALAQDFQRLVVEASGADQGGMMPNKAVRCVGSHNLKPAHNGFKCRLTAFEGWRVSPADLLDASGCGVSWAAVQQGLGPQHARRGSTTLWQPRAQQYMAGGDSVVDPVLLWLRDRGLVVDEGVDGSWITIQCPQHHDHTTGDPYASYAPLGRGEMPEQRGFHCFHSHCAGLKTTGFLRWVLGEGGPAAPVADPSGGELSKWAFNSVANEWVEMDGAFRRIRTAGFREARQQVVWVPGASDGEQRSVPLYTLLVRSPQLMVLEGEANEPGGPALLARADGSWQINSWRAPVWPSSSAQIPDDHPDVARVVDFVRYLLPDPDDATFILDMMTCKARDARFRGPGVIMTTPTQGTGRNSLYRIISSLWGAWNCAEPSTGELMTGLSGGFNAWLTSSWMLVSELNDAALGGREQNQAYEGLKRYCEPSGVKMLIKHKYGGEDMATCYGTLMLASNHARALNLDVTDRRFRWLECTTLPRDVDNFADLYAWLETAWQAPVWQWLLERDTGAFNGFAPQNLDFDALRGFAGGNGIDRAVKLCVSYCEDMLRGFVDIDSLVAGLAPYEARLGLLRIRGGWVDIFRQEMMDCSTTFREAGKKGHQLRIGGRRLRPRRLVGTPRGNELATQFEDSMRRKALRASDVLHCRWLGSAYRDAVLYDERDVDMLAYFQDVLDEFEL